MILMAAGLLGKVGSEEAVGQTMKDRVPDSLSLRQTMQALSRVDPIRL